jgi:PTS system mannose-specific IID component
VKKSILIKIFLRSFFIHAALNFRRMQNLGFALAIIPLIREWRLQEKDSESMLTRHLQMYNSHPYFSAPLIGSVVRLEEDYLGKGNTSDVVAVKQGLMGPYAAIGDIFFWSALRPFAGIVAVYLAFMGFIIAPLAFLVIYTPAHFWLRAKGFIEGYRRGKQGIEFIRAMDLPRVSVKLRWLSLLTLTVLAIWLTYGWYWPFIADTSGIIVKSAALASVLPSLFLIKKGVSQIYIIYGAFVIFLLIISCRELFN